MLLLLHLWKLSSHNVGRLHRPCCSDGVAAYGNAVGSCKLKDTVTGRVQEWFPWIPLVLKHNESYPAVENGISMHTYDCWVVGLPKLQPPCQSMLCSPFELTSTKVISAPPLGCLYLWLFYLIHLQARLSSKDQPNIEGNTHEQFPPPADCQERAVVNIVTISISIGRQGQNVWQTLLPCFLQSSGFMSETAGSMCLCWWF